MSDSTPSAARHLRTSDQRLGGAKETIVAYLLENSAIYRRLSALREKGWNNPEGDIHFKMQREAADNANKKKAKTFYYLMQRIGKELQSNTQAFTIPDKGSEAVQILDMCMAPGGFLKIALDMNPGSQAFAFSLPLAQGGHYVFLRSSCVTVTFCDITMLAADMDVEYLPEATIDAKSFIRSRVLPPEMQFDLAICDGQVLRKEKHQRAPYRELCESTRLLSTQLALSLEHLRPNGTMIVLLHRLDTYHTATLLRDFYQFSRVRLHKPKAGHATRSSFYMVASKVKSQDQEAMKAVHKWKEAWRRATFQQQEQESDIHDPELSAELLMDEFGPILVEIGEPIWDCQAEALADAPFIREKVPEMSSKT